MASLLLVAVGLQQISERLRQSRGLVHQARGLGDRGGHGTDPECADLAFVDRELAAALPDERVDATAVLEHGSKMVDAVELADLLAVDREALVARLDLVAQGPA